MADLDPASRARAVRYAAAMARIAADRLEHEGPHPSELDPSERTWCPGCSVHNHLGGTAACPRCGVHAMQQRLAQALHEVDRAAAAGAPVIPAGIPVPDMRLPREPDNDRF
jgi:hypothetical protein